MTGAGGIPTERQTQRAILAMCGRLFPEVWITHVPNGAHFAGTPRQRAMQMGALKGDGLKTGTPDLLCIWECGQGCFMEVKRLKGGKVSDDQQSVIAALMARNWPVAVVRSIDEAHAFLKRCGAPCLGELA